MSVLGGPKSRTMLASGSYFLLVFGTGFLLGAIRVIWVEPWLGKTLAVASEMPLMLAAIFAAARWLPQKFGMQLGFWPLLQMGLGALLLQQIADFGVGTCLRKMSLAEQFAYLETPAGTIYLAASSLFAAMPLLVHANNLHAPKASVG